ncbi:hypothetical protein TYRP_006274 [Tyrophagus putrescentiae]|nr:hypothetical protein TYRP_006274 [Tyrophagus putrescentiae]
MTAGAVQEKGVHLKITAAEKVIRSKQKWSLQGVSWHDWAIFSATIFFCCPTQCQALSFVLGSTGGGGGGGSIFLAASR